MTTEWPPTEEQIKNIASSALHHSEKKNVHVLVYWENDPNLMIFDPFHFAKTEYVERKYNYEGREVMVTVGRID